MIFSKNVEHILSYLLLFTASKNSRWKLVYGKLNVKKTLDFDLFSYTEGENFFGPGFFDPGSSPRVKKSTFSIFGQKYKEGTLVYFFGFWAK